MFKRLMTKEDRAAARKAFIRPGWVKVSPKGLDAEFYLHEMAGRFYAVGFIGSAGRPAFHYSFRSLAARDGFLARQMESLQASAKYKAERKAKSQALACKLEVGHILVTCWGYDQTNREFFKVLEKKGERTLIVQEVEQIDASRGDEGWMCGKALPGEELKKGSKPYMVRVTGADHVKIEGHYASLWDGKPADWTGYA